MADDYAPTTEDVEVYFALGLVEYSPGNGHTISAAHDAFRRWLAQYTAALRAEWEAERSEVRHTFDSDDCVTNECDCALAEQGTEEPEWEYGYGSIADAEAERPTMRRRKAGPWVPVEQEGESA